MIESVHNEQVKYVASLQRRKAREDAHLYVVEGARFVEEAVLRNAPLKKVYICLEREPARWQSLRSQLRERNIPWEEVNERVLGKMSATEEPQGILAVVRQIDHSWSEVTIDGQTLLLIVDGIQDPGNLGTILRTALAAGVRYVCLTPGTVDVYNPKVLRSTMGALFSLTLLPARSPESILDFCQQKGLNVLIGDIGGETIYRTNLAQGPMALVVGNEGNGPSPAFTTGGVQRVTIPMAQNVESLNVAMATGILLYELVRQRDFL